jgi:lysophospholipase L1-like esterase
MAPRTRLAALLVVTLALSAAGSIAHAADARAAPFELRDGDVVALVGNTFIEQEQAHSYIETLLASRWPGREIKFRNLGWSGDTVLGEARAMFDKAPQGFDRLMQRVKEVKPSVVFVSYGMNESFAGPAGLGEFKQGLERLLDRLGETKARVALIGPIRHEDLGRPYPDPAEHNRNLRLYADAMKEIAQRRGCGFVDLFTLLGDGAVAGSPGSPARLTTNGIHPSPYGYWRAAGAIEQGLGLPPRGWAIAVDASQGGSKAEGVRIADVKAAEGRVSFRTDGETLPPPPAPADAPPGATLPGAKRVVRVTGLPPGRYVLKADGAALASGTERQWADGVEIGAEHDPLAQQAQKLRQAAIDKNEQFFNQWRPANWTYIFGFRRHEQGRNAAEMPQFDQYIARKEAEMAKLRAAASRTFTLEREQP